MWVPSPTTFWEALPEASLQASSSESNTYPRPPRASFSYHRFYVVDQAVVYIGTQQHNSSGPTPTYPVSHIFFWFAARIKSASNVNSKRLFLL